MNPQIKKHFVITVHYGDPVLTTQAIDSLLQNTDPPDHIIVINHSNPLSLPPHPSLIQINPATNAGYAAGINMGLGLITTLPATPGDIVTCLNNDVIVPPDTFTKLRRWWQDHPGDHLLGLTTHQANGTPQQSGRVNLLTGRSRLTNKSLPDQSLRSFFSLPYLHGAGFSTSLHLLLTNHGLPSEYFMYWEDVLFSRQLARRHVSLCTTPDIAILHLNDRPPSFTPDNKLYYLVRNGALFLERETPGLWRNYWWVLNRLRYAYHRWRRQQPTVIRALQDAIRQTTGPINNS